jgi:hypothetical protein
VAYSGGVESWLAGGRMVGVMWVGWGVCVVVWVVSSGLIFYVLTVVIGKYVYIKSWSDILYVCDDSVYIYSVDLLHKIKSIVDSPLLV